MFVLTPHIVTY